MVVYWDPVARVIDGRLSHQDCRLIGNDLYCEAVPRDGSATFVAMRVLGGWQEIPAGVLVRWLRKTSEGHKTVVDVLAGMGLAHWTEFPPYKTD